jgi:hypothetical protein
MKKVKALYILILVILCFSCSRSGDQNEFELVQLQDLVTDTLYLHKDERTKSLPTVLHYIELPTGPVLMAFENFRLLTYDYPSGRLKQIHEFEKEGPDGVGSWISGYLINDEGVFLLSDLQQVTWADHKGKLLDKLNYPKVDETKRLGPNFSTMNGNAMHWDSQARTLTVADVPYVLKQPNMEYIDWIWKFDFGKRQTQAISFRYPNSYNGFFDDPELGVFSGIFVQELGTHVVSFPVSDSLLLMDRAGSVKWVFAGSSKPLVFEKGKTEQQGEWEVFLPSETTSRYKSLLYDPFSASLLRAVVISGQSKEGENPYLEQSFVVMDQSYRRKKELFFNSDQFASTGFITPDGLHLKLANQISDDEVAYVRIVLDRE